ncbi:cadherin-like protein 26 [Pristis pectinata]|uniref:cadherin-like protein 26 n=1 Tax=Pristis pectinata TaxID=685728 RepID=UPI00223D1A9B|nr:cadherin-like protein 26 [Pristis pectinata]XP_051887259.1 cadherin-like protein 26 [Pristis pectinata]
MGFGIHTLVLFFIIDMCRAEGQHSIILHRQKRRWISAVFKLIEEDPGPYPKKAIKLSNDKSQNHSLLFSISGEGVERDPEKNLFSIDKYTGEIFVHHKVDREKTKSLMFQVDAMDRDTLNVVDDHMLYKIQVIDINDNRPEFKQAVYDVDVLEATYPGAEVFRIEAEDADDKSNGNGFVSYSIVSQDPKIPSNVFKIDAKNGSILLQKCLNYEAIKSYSLIIKARDNGQNVTSSSAEVRINVIDSNTYPPILTQKSVSGSINESDKNIVILRVGVTDQDTPNTPAWRAKYKIIEGNENENYRMETDPETNDGLLIVIKSVDYELGPQRNLRITVENEEPLFTCPDTEDNINRKPQELSAVITVKDLNDPPVFDPPVITINEVEGQKPGKVLGRFNAYDTDTFYKHSIKYYRGHEPAEWVTVDSETGVVTTVKELDRESPYVNNSVYTFTVYAVEDDDIPITGTGTLSLILADINDNLPYLKTKYASICDEGEVQFITVSASDEDLEPFGGPFTFELLDNEQHIKKNWKLGKATDNTVQLQRIRKVPIGNYTIPFKIRDRQGITQESSLNLHVCHCIDERTCPVPLPATSSLGGAAIGLLLAGLLLLILGLCLLLFCTFKKKFLKPYNEPTWTLIKYNDEGVLVDSQKPASIYISEVASKEVGLGAERNSINSGIQGHLEGMTSFVDGTMRQIKANNSRVWSTRDNSQRYEDGRLRMNNMSQRYNSYGWANRHNMERSSRAASLFISRNSSRFYGAQDWGTREYSEPDTGDAEVMYKPVVYSYEGEEASMLTLDSISRFEDNISLSYLNDLGPKFKALAKICQEKNPHLSQQQ